MKILVFDTAITGHHSEYIGHLIDYLFENNQDKHIDYSFVVHPEFSSRFPVIFEKAHKIENLTWIQIELKEENTIKGGLMRKSFASYRILHRYARRLQVDHVCSLDFHTIKYGSILFRTRYTLSGILFVQFHRLGKKSFKEKWTYYKRFILTKLSVLNRKLICVFVLNDWETVNHMNTEFKTKVFRMLPDPIPNHAPLPNFDIYKQYSIDPNRKVFLHIGSLGDRKGTMEIVEAALHINTEQQKHIAILLVGMSSNDEERKLIKEKIASCEGRSKVKVLWDESFVSNAQMKSLFNQCFAVLIPYKNAEYSSGILGHAAASQKMVIATGKGLLKEMVLKYNLGLLVEKPTPIQIADKIIEAMSYVHSLEESNKLVNQHKPAVFSKLLLDFQHTNSTIGL